MDPVLIVLIGIAVTLVCIIFLRLHALVSLIFAALVTGLITSPSQIYDYAIHNGLSEAASQALSQKMIGARLSDAFGKTVGNIGILIAFASIIGTALMKSGGAERIIRSLIKLTGEKNTSLAFLTGSFTLGIPVFFDTVFYLMIPLVKSISVRNPKKFSLYLMSVMAGGVMAHSLVPPTPGPLFVAKELGVDIGVMMIGGIVVGIFTVICGYFYARWANRKWELPMRDTPDISISELKQNTEVNQSQLPALWISLLPVLLPVLLITGKTFLEMMIDPKDPATSALQQNLLAAFRLLGDSNIALFIAAMVAMYLLWSKTKAVKPFEKYITESIYSAGMIILITAAGGTFGQMLQQTGIGLRIADFAQGFHIAILPLAFFITLVIRTAQGSATVAMVTAIGIMSGFQGTEGFGFHPVYLALVIGCGSKIFPWMNDSGFWIVTKMSGMEEKESIRFFSYLLTVMGFSGLVITMILSLVFPFA